MAMEALKSAGIKAYQGSSKKPAVQTVETAVRPEAPATVKVVKVAEKTASDAALVKKPEPKREKKGAEAAAYKSGGSPKAAEKPLVKEAAITPELIFSENKESTEAVSADKLKRAVEELNKRSVESEAVFGVHDSTNRMTIKIVDKKTKEVLKEYPPEKTLDMIAKVWELAGLLVDEKG